MLKYRERVHDWFFFFFFRFLRVTIILRVISPAEWDDKRWNAVDVLVDCPVKLLLFYEFVNLNKKYGSIVGVYHR